MLCRGGVTCLACFLGENTRPIFTLSAECPIQGGFTLYLNVWAEAAQRADYNYLFWVGGLILLSIYFIPLAHLGWQSEYVCSKGCLKLII